MQFECIDANEKGGPNHIFGPNHNITYVAHRGGGRGGGRDCNTRPQFTSCGSGFGQVSHNYHNSALELFLMVLRLPLHITCSHY